MTKFKTLHIKPETWCRLNKIRSQLILAGLPHTFDDAVKVLLDNRDDWIDNNIKWCS